MAMDRIANFHSSARKKRHCALGASKLPYDKSRSDIRNSTYPVAFAIGATGIHKRRAWETRLIIFPITPYFFSAVSIPLPLNNV